MMRIFSPLLGWARSVGHRREVQALTELDEHTLRDVGLLRTDVYAALAEPFHRDPSQVLRTLCCHWQSFGSRFRPAVEPAPCC